MSYRIENHETLLAGVRRVAREQIAKALAELDDRALDQATTVHQVRKRCKKLRGLLRLYRPAARSTYKNENVAFRDASRLLGPLRDCEALSTTVAAFTEEGSDAETRTAVDEVGRVLNLRRNQAANAVFSAPERLNQFRQEMEEALRRVETWETGLEDPLSIEKGVTRPYRRARRAMAAAYDDPHAENFHEWRKRVKYHWYHMRLLRDCWKAVLRARRDELDDLSDLLGDEHDRAVLAEWLCRDSRMRDSKAARVLLPQIEQQRGKLQSKARPLGERLFCEKPKQFGTRLRSYWVSWRTRSRCGGRKVAESSKDG